MSSEKGLSHYLWDPGVTVNPGRAISIKGGPNLVRRVFMPVRINRSGPRSGRSTYCGGLAL
jgi:hypothetical protein